MRIVELLKGDELMKRFLSGFIFFVFATGVPVIAHADCTFVSGPCSTDSRGNTYRTERNLGGGYTTYKNGNQHSTTGQTLGGGYRERFNDGSHRDYNHNPYSESDRNPYGYR